MKDVDYALLIQDTLAACVGGARSIGILGLTPTTIRLIESLGPSLIGAVTAVYVEGEPDVSRLASIPVLPMVALQRSREDVLVVAADAEKEDLLLSALPHVRGTPKVILSGYEHFSFRDRAYHEELAQLLVPSLANGYPNTLVHLYQCLVNASRLDLRGVVAEFGMFKGGTTMFLARVARRLRRDWRVIGFDTFGGFPPRRSVLDMYDHPDCIFTDAAAVRRYLGDQNVEIVVGDIVETCRRLEHEDVVVSFVDTDNYTSARAVLEVIRERTVVGGAIVFDHFTGVDRFRYTLGERIAGRILLDDSRYLNLHGTGVFYKQR